MRNLRERPQASGDDEEPAANASSDESRSCVELSSNGLDSDSGMYSGPGEAGHESDSLASSDLYHRRPGEADSGLSRVELSSSGPDSDSGMYSGAGEAGHESESLASSDLYHRRPGEADSGLSCVELSSSCLDSDSGMYSGPGEAGHESDSLASSDLYHRRPGQKRPRSDGGQSASSGELPCSGSGLGSDADEEGHDAKPSAAAGSKQTKSGGGQGRPKTSYGGGGCPRNGLLRPSSADDAAVPCRRRRRWKAMVIRTAYAGRGPTATLFATDDAH